MEGVRNKRRKAIKTTAIIILSIIVGVLIGAISFCLKTGHHHHLGTDIWRSRTGYWVYSSPTVADGVVYIGSVDNNLYALDARTGREKWRFYMVDDIASPPDVSDR